ncbi:alpha-protein kinase 1 isoform X2 [Parambassis ranga]|uniref:Alpha-protein kinase 1 isoform X2 n=1 Tax=Parambassis ranga TaxID=210632 RepID=A0A6P7K7B4_9TELE|nr:alpha-protein kinase 1 isoform X2 [Parambassis ranga]
MDSQELGDLLEVCLKEAAAAQQCDTQKLNYCRCRDLLCAELASLLQEAMEMKWPFVPEKWQYKQAVSANDKTNLSDLISKHLPQLLALLKASIMAQESHTALAVIFLVDRFLYWTDESSRLLKIAKVLHRRHPDSPIAPQLVIRQARVYLNSGKLRKAEHILSRLINSSGTTGCWIYHSESDRALVQAVSVQVRGMILQMLGLWLEAAELIWASLVGYYSLPQPDKKGIGSSLCILANILVSMSDDDFHAFRTNSDVDFSLLGEGSHRLLSAAQAAKMAVVYSQYTSLYVLTNVVTQGTCLLSYSFSVECPAAQRQTYLLQAREAFVVGLLTKSEGELVTSKQELHTFIKAAYCLTVTLKWLGTAVEVVSQASQACQQALANFYYYCHADTHDKDNRCSEIMHLVAQVKLLLRVEPFTNSEKGSFIPDSYRDVKDTSVKFTLEGFSKIMQRFQRYHASLCETTSKKCRGAKDEVDGRRLCITALGTTIGTLSTECSTEACRVLKGSINVPQKSDLCTTQGNTDNLGSSWENFSLSSSGSPRPSSSGYAGSSAPVLRGENVRNQSCLSTEVDDDSMLQSADNKKKRNTHPGSHRAPRSAIASTSSSSTSSGLENFEMIQAGIETLATEEDVIIDVSDVVQETQMADGAAKSLSQLTLKTSSSSFAACSKSSDSDGSFFLMETLDSESSDSALDHKHTSRWEVKPQSKPQPVENVHFDPNMETEVDSVPVQPATNNSPQSPTQAVLEQCAATETSTESSFEMLEMNQSGLQHDEVKTNVNVPQRRNPLCYNCQNNSTAAGVDPRRQFLLSQQDYQALLAGVCNECLLRRFHSEKTQFKLKEHRAAYSALHLKFSKASGLWTARETCVFIGHLMEMQGKQRAAIWVQFLHQEERLSSYVGKDYLKPKEIHFHLKDVERQMTAQYYVTEFNKSLYDKEVMAQIFFIPSEALLILNGDEIVGCVTVEPYMLGDFVKLTNNTGQKNESFQATEYGLAFGHFTYLFSEGQEVVVDLQGWVTANGKGLTYLTDPQIHSTRTPRGPSNFADRGLRYFREEQHGPECNVICQLLKLPPLSTQPYIRPQKL